MEANVEVAVQESDSSISGNFWHFGECDIGSVEADINEQVGRFLLFIGLDS